MASPRYTLVSRHKQPMSLYGGETTRFRPLISSFLGYLGCSESEFSAFAVGIEFVPVYTEYCKIMRSISGGTESHLPALCWLSFCLNSDGSRNIERCATSDSDGTTNLNKSVIPYTLKEAWERYGSGEKRDGTKLIGCLLYITDEIFQRAAHKHDTNSAELLQAASSARTYAELEEQTKWKIPSQYQTSDTWAFDRVLPKGLRSECIQQHNEQVCERWNRIWHCFQVLDYYRKHKQPVISRFEDFRQPAWWQTRTTGTQPVEGIKKTLATRHVECEMKLTSGNVNLKTHLERSSYKDYAEIVQKMEEEMQVILSPVHFKSLEHWLAYIGAKFKFKELEICFKEIDMFLVSDDEWWYSDTHTIYDEVTEWSPAEVAKKFDDVSAATTRLSCVLETGSPIEVKFGKPKGLMHIFTYDSKGQPILEAVAVAQSLCDASSSANTNSDLVMSDVAPQDTAAQSPGSDLDQPSSIDVAIKSDHSAVLNEVNVNDTAKQLEQDLDPFRMDTEDAQQPVPNPVSSVEGESTTKNTHGSTTEKTQEPQETQENSAGLLEKTLNKIRLDKCRLFVLFLHNAIHITEPHWTMVMLFNRLLQVARSSNWHMHLCFTATALWMGLKVIEVDEVASGVKPNAVFKKTPIIFARLHEWIIHLFYSYKTGLSLNQISALDPFRRHTNPFHEQQFRRMGRVKARLLHTKKYEQRSFTSKDAALLVDINVKMASLNKLLFRVSDVSDTDKDALAANAAEDCITGLDCSGSLATDAHLDAYISAVEMISKIDLKRHHHFRAQMSIFHTIALCVEYLQERYDGNEPHNAKADNLDFGRVDKLISVSKSFTTAKMKALQALDRGEFDTSSPMAVDFGREMCEEVCLRRATTAWQSLRALQKRLAPQEDQVMED